MSKKRALLILNGELTLDSNEIESLKISNKINKVIAVDGGSNAARSLKIIPDLIIGDLDSVSDQSLAYFKNNGVEIIRHPVEKDQTDSEIAVDYCFNNEFEELFIIAALGGRFDQQLANINLLEYIYNLNLKAKIISKNSEIALIKKSKVFNSKVGSRLSLIPQSKEVKNLKISGCKYNLSGRDILRSRSRGISNYIVDEKAEISLESGLLIYVLENISSE